MRKGILLATILSLFFCVSSYARAQNSDETTAKPRPIEAYRLDFSFNEFEGEKKINTRHYSMDLTSGQHPNEIKIGLRVPVVSGTVGGSTQFQYVDVGTRISAQLRPNGQSDEQELVVNSDVSNVDVTAEAGSTPNQAPVIRQIKIEGVTLLKLGTPLLIGSMDDPNSKRQFQLEVTVTKLR
ncbi:MAG TPA: hypothetical protein VKV39_14265 [Candidatus Sulfotelmatobacter sp.]|nr:hypothetical protein [Candidatus Sulfotelmatobacter sp.]